MLLFSDVMKFNGPGPELVNGRLAMLGLLLAARSEMLTGQTVMQQMAAPQGSLVAAMLVIVYASLVPLLKGARHEAFGARLSRAWAANATRPHST